MPGSTAASPAAPPARVSARGWGWRHASRRAWALAGVDLEIDPGERVLLLGASGAGKSTLLHALAGVLGGDEEGESRGELLVDGEPPAAARGRSGLVLQDPDAQVILARVGDDVAFGCENLGIPREEIWPRVRQTLDAVGLDVPLDRPTKALSGGQKQRLALAGALAMRPGLLLLDEPTANLDPAGVAEVRDAVGRVLDATGATFVVVEHRVDVWLPLVDRVIVLGAEGVVADGAPDAVLGTRGAALAAAGVWVPGIPPALPPAPERPPGEVLLRGRGLAVARVRGVPVASGLDVDVRAGAALAITGPNGAGKSTLALTLAGLLPAAAGGVVAAETLDAGAGDSPIRWRSRELLTRIGTVFQDPEHQLLRTTVRDELEVGPRALQRSARGPSDAQIAARTDDLLERLRLTPLARANPYTLSGGEKRRLTVAAALATSPRVLVLDEPTFGQDARTWAELVALLAALRDEGGAIVAVTHDEAVVAALHAERYALTGPAGTAAGEAP
ncbi:MAG: ATP-binding cassette domain-containing protein [Microbacterium sp.]|uniref:ABC transporter ATP-binding protein n=1 Tax=Microbacterium sp. TaxID=51671 RepID=UPI001AD235B1|nr:ATP-binding cassette domain-containing protein [Microbacterium sp.]MBN9176628.1 ATP-binding cassette domain-containing protein [Microbacterium sp.]